MAAPVIGVVLDSKFLIMLGALIFVVSRCKKTADEIVFDVCKAIILVGVVNFGFVVRDVFSGGVSLSGIELGRSNIIGYAPIGLFSHKINNALLFSMAFSAAIVLYLFKRKNVYLLLSGGFLVSLLLASSMKELAVLLSVLILLMKVFSGQDSKFKKSGRSLFVAALLLAPVLAFIFGSELAKLMSSRVSEYIFEENARAALYVASTQIANDYFPFGSGAGTFASQPSRSLYYSPIYYEYGVNFYYGASSEYSSFLMDVGWPKFLAEAGWLGGGAYFLAYFMALIGLVLSFLRSPSAVNMFGLMVGTVVFSSALGSAVFTGDMGLMACAILLFCRYLDKCKS